MLAMAAAFFRTIGEALSLFSHVDSQGINESDRAKGMPGDILCYSNDEVCLVVEVKDMTLTLAHVQASSLKAKQSGLKLENLLFAVPGVKSDDREKIEELTKQEWASGFNIHIIGLEEIIHAIFTILNEKWRIHFLENIGKELDHRQDLPARKDWHDQLLNTK